ncbi:YopX family protein [Hydrogenivirga sp. 128-5-R1-1]|uniref:YopX family protein n=1 Tax=Hydrogenivirga sp. 128-5-R1-1 TaxID=392423 RepID=UPI00015F023F|nr:YopX family protein [Hydrogenivirga sp. 128-5-R1-1]EDP73571.1 hypothetical protein HG1285_07774 [Hydrogenivirga sp. 128-5-R1-1]
MREIKFRVWDKTDKDMKIVVSIDFEFGTVKCLNAIGFSIRRFNEIVLMQYTGLKDKNGKEIYEEDIVKLKDFYYEDVIGIVKFGDGEFYVDCLPQDNPYSSCIIGMAFIDEQNIEVIGNIYEHKHLLEDKNV